MKCEGRNQTETNRKSHIVGATHRSSTTQVQNHIKQFNGVNVASLEYFPTLWYNFQVNVSFAQI